MQIEEKGKNTVVKNPIADCRLGDTLDCGQCFRFREREDGSFFGIVRDKAITLTQTDDKIIFYDTTETEFNEIWKEYFDFNTDYNKLRGWLSEDNALKAAISYSSGIHILKQDSFEALISFIISQNNNIPRIKGTIERLCKRFGKRLSCGEYAFPVLDDLKSTKKSDYAELGLGYRDDYIVDCVEKISSGEINLSKIREMSLDDGRAALRRIKGVGPKVADCALLFGFYQTEAFPIDTWVKKVLKEFYPNGFPEKYKSVSGIAQQYLFHYMRHTAK